MKNIVLIGMPGTGKSTIIRAMLYCWKALYHNEDWLLMAPSGRAARRITETTECPAFTLHSALKIPVLQDTVDLPEALYFVEVTRGLVIVDEASMVDQFTAATLMSSLKGDNKQHLVFIGDPDQLPSVGAGNVLADMISSGRIPMVCLDVVFQQAEGNPIIENSQRIQRGETALDWSQRSFRRFNYPTDRENMEAACVFYMRCVKAYGKENVVMLSPYRKKTDICSNAFNKALQNKVNPDVGQSSMTRKGVTFRKGDLVMQIRNADDVVNGDIGVVTDIAIPRDSDTGELCCIVAFENGAVVAYPKEELVQLDLAYCLSVHKSQGSQYKTVITVLPHKPSQFLRRNLFYTAITRAEENVAVFASLGSVAYAIGNDKADLRYTRLEQRLREGM